MDPSHDHIAAAHAALIMVRQALNAEISNYPTPISGCDAQFNGLLSDRARVNAAINALNVPVFIPTPRSPDAFSGVESR
ncbi:MAG: hypothetical protein AAGJ94_09915 [Pseudomonadota bacterium]